MRLRNCVCVVVASLGLLAVGYAQEPSAPGRFNGLNMNLGNLYRLSERPDALDQPGELHRREGQGRHGHRRDRQGRRAGAGPGLEGFALGRHQGEVHLHHGGDQRAGRDPADLDDPRPDRQDPAVHPPLLLGRRGRALGRGADGRLLRLRLGQVLPDQLAARLRQSRQRLQLLLDHALPQEGQDHAGEPRRRAT